MSDLLEKKRKRAHRTQKKEGKTRSWIKKTRWRRAGGKETVKTVAIYYVSIWFVFTFHGDQIRNGRRAKKIIIKVKPFERKTIRYRWGGCNVECESDNQ